MLQLNVLIVYFVFQFPGYWGHQSNCCTQDIFGNYQGTQDLFYTPIVGQEYTEDIYRPCTLDDIVCMRQYLASVSECQPACGPAPDPFIMPVNRFFFPLANLTITHNDLEIKGLNSTTIEEFYVNKATGNVVVTFRVRNIDQKCQRSDFLYYRTGREPIIRTDYTAVFYNSATFTAVLPKIPNLRIERAEIYAEIYDENPFYDIGPNACNSTDPTVIKNYQYLIDNIPIAVQESFVFQAGLLTTTILQEYLCDFGFDSYTKYLDFTRTK